MDMDDEKRARAEVAKARLAGTKALGTPMALGTNPRAKARNKWAPRDWKRGKRSK
jgi:hypothetical protein